MDSGSSFRSISPRLACNPNLKLPAAEAITDRLSRVGMPARDNKAMSKPIRRSSFLPHVDPIFEVKRRKPIPHEFVLDALAGLSPETRPMFGCLAVYVGPKIVLILRDKRKPPEDDGVWLATTEEHHQSLRREFPNMRSIRVLEKKVTGWQVLPADAPDFEQAALRACELIAEKDPRIGKVPQRRRRKSRAKR